MAGGRAGPVVRRVLLGRLAPSGLPHRLRQRPVQHVPAMAPLCRLFTPPGPASAVEPVPVLRHPLRRQPPAGALLSADVAGVAAARHHRVGLDHRAARMAGRRGDVCLDALGGGLGRGRAVRCGDLCLQRLLFRAPLRRPPGGHHHRGLAAAGVVGLPARCPASFVEARRSGRGTPGTVHIGGAHGLVYLRGARIGRLRCLLCLGCLAWGTVVAGSATSPGPGWRHAPRRVGPGRGPTPSHGRAGAAFDPAGCVQLRFRLPLLVAARLPADAVGAQLFRGAGANGILGRRHL